MNLAKNGNYGSFLLRWVRGKSLQTSSFQVLPCRNFSQSKPIFQSSMKQKEGLDQILKKLVNFYKGNVGHHHSNRSDELLEAEKQAKRELNWLIEKVESSTKSSDNQMRVTTVSNLVQRLLNHEPLSYVLGDQPFGPLSIQCVPPTLIPRPETEALTEYVFDQLKHTFSNHLSQIHNHSKPIQILDLCTGSGCISLLLRHRLLELISKDAIKDYNVNRKPFHNPPMRIIGVDIADSALKLAGQNLNSYNQDENYQDLVSQNGYLVPITFEKLDMLNDTSIDDFITNHGPSDVIICNPPYISQKEWKRLDVSVRDWEDRLALVGHAKNESDGLFFYERLANLIETKKLLASSTNKELPLVSMEVGHDQAGKVRDMFVAKQNVSRIGIWTDPFGKERAVIAQYGT